MPSFEEDIGSYFAHHQNGNYRTILNDSMAKQKKSKNNKRAFKKTMTTPILFKADKFKLIYTDFRSKATIALLQFIDEANEEKLNESDEKCSVPDADGSFLWIANVHLEGNPQKVDVRFCQMKNVLNKMAHKSNDGKLDLSKVSAYFVAILMHRRVK